MPVLALGGGLWGDRPLHMLQEVADDVRGGTVPGVGHWIPEEDPEALVAWLRTFINDTPLAEATWLPPSRVSPVLGRPRGTGTRSAR